LQRPRGYLLAGFVIGPHGLQLIVASDEARFLAEFGIIFLTFMVGLAFFALGNDCRASRGFRAGSLQVGFTIFIVTGIAALSDVSLSGR
jgi:CPA2 family monovalent cation:H+ antiporter-2